MKNFLFLFGLITISLTSCIQDFVEPTIRITTTPNTILIGTQYQFDFAYFNNIGQQENITPTWTSSDPSLLSIDQNGTATGLMKGSVSVTAAYSDTDINISESLPVNIGEESIEEPLLKSGNIRTTSSYLLEGNFEITEENNILNIKIADNYKASTALPGLYIYLTNNTSSTSGAYEIGAVETFSGEHSYEIQGVGINDYSHILYFCKPFNVKVGDGEIK